MKSQELIHESQSLTNANNELKLPERSKSQALIHESQSLSNADNELKIPEHSKSHALIHIQFHIYSSTYRRFQPIMQTFGIISRV